MVGASSPHSLTRRHLADVEFDRSDYEGIHLELPQKTVEEIKEYALVFWKRYREIEGESSRLRVVVAMLTRQCLVADYDKQIAKIEAAEAKRELHTRQSALVKRKVDSVKYPLTLLKIQYANQTKGKSYSEEEDRFILVKLAEYGYGPDDTAERIKRDIVEHPSFRFDWFLKSRTPAEIGRRMTTLVTLIEKELDGKKPAVKKAAAPANGSSTAKGKVSSFVDAS